MSKKYHKRVNEIIIKLKGCHCEHNLYCTRKLDLTYDDKQFLITALIYMRDKDIFIEHHDTIE